MRKRRQKAVPDWGILMYSPFWPLQPDVPEGVLSKTLSGYPKPQTMLNPEPCLQCYFLCRYLSDKVLCASQAQ